MICAFCQRHLNGDAFVRGDDVMHATCAPKDDRKRRGLLYKCPKCDTRGQVFAGKTRTVRKYVAGDPRSSCGYDGCRGCVRCRGGLQDVEERVSEECPLCSGEGYLTREPVPVTKVVDWEVPP